MENASKALIIAGAILIAIVLIAVGVLVVNNMNEPVEQGVEGMTDQAKQIFNRKFESYQGTQNANNVRALLSAIITSNSSNTQIHKVKVTYESDEKEYNIPSSDSEDDISKAQRDITTDATYTVEFGYDSGVITSVTITSSKVPKS